jgi:hypothetical protein
MISGSTPGKMVGCTRVITETIKSMAMVSTLGPTKKGIQDGGTRESSMVLESL